jgi:hypothetical protein
MFRCPGGTVGKSLLDVLREVVIDPAERTALDELGVTGYLARHGYEDVDPDDLREAVSLAADALPPDIAQVLADASQPAPGADQAPDATHTSSADDDAGDHAGGETGDDSLVAFGAGFGAGSPEEDASSDAADHDSDEGGLTFEAEPSFDITPAVNEGLDSEDSLEQAGDFGDDLPEDPTTDGAGPAELNDIGSF